MKFAKLQKKILLFLLHPKDFFGQKSEVFCTLRLVSGRGLTVDYVLKTTCEAIRLLEFGTAS